MMQFVTPTTPLSLRMVCSAFSRSKAKMTSPESVTWPLTAATWIELNRIFQREGSVRDFRARCPKGLRLKLLAWQVLRNPVRFCARSAGRAPSRHQASHCSARRGDTDENEVACLHNYRTATSELLCMPIFEEIVTSWCCCKSVFRVLCG